MTRPGDPDDAAAADREEARQTAAAQQVMTDDGGPVHPAQPGPSHGPEADGTVPEPPAPDDAEP